MSNEYLRNKSIKNTPLFTLPNIKESMTYLGPNKTQYVKLFPTNGIVNHRHQAYTLEIEEEREIGQIGFNEFGGIISCLHIKPGVQKEYSLISVSRFKERFLPLIKQIVPQDQYLEYLIALDLGNAGIMIEADEERFPKNDYLLGN